MNVEQLYFLLWEFAGQRVVTVANRVGMLGRLAGPPVGTDEMAAELGLDGLACAKMVRALCALGLAERHGKEERYSLVAGLGEHFSGGEMDFGAFVEHAHGLYDRWGASLEEWVRTGEHVRGQRSRERVLQFGRAMQASASLLAPRVIEALGKLEGIERVLDVGGGVGGYAAAFCRVNPKVSVTVLDVAEVAELGEEQWQGTELSGRIDYKAGDYHTAKMGQDYDLVLLANVLHIEKPKDAAALIDRAADALKPGGRLAVIDFEIDDDKHSNRMGALFAVNMRSFGDAHSLPQISGWLQVAGFGEIKKTSLPPAHWLIHGVKSG